MADNASLVQPITVAFLIGSLLDVFDNCIQIFVLAEAARLGLFAQANNQLPQNIFGLDVG